MQCIRLKPVATNVTCSVVCVCVLVTRMCCAKTSELLEMPLGGLTVTGPRSLVLDGGQDRTNPFATIWSDKSAAWPNYFGHCYMLVLFTTDKHVF